MEKLVKLLNEYEKDKYGFSSNYFELEIDDETGEPTGGIVDSSEDTFEVTSYYISMKIISKRFGFIERLVKNDKVDLENLIIKEVEDRGGNKVIKDIKYYSDYESLLMILSIQDNPIEFLVSILK